jgi:hypothetical protein
MKWRYEEATKTIRSVPENYWIATMDSFEGAVNHERNAKLIAAAPVMLDALRSVAAAYQQMFDVMPVAWETFDNIVNEAIEKAEL